MELSTLLTITSAEITIARQAVEKDVVVFVIRIVLQELLRCGGGDIAQVIFSMYYTINKQRKTVLIAADEIIGNALGYRFNTRPICPGNDRDF